jgi:D-arabinose 1-dehydrogenase-like Zn-dependent alcohol dehydrogenase
VTAHNGLRAAGASAEDRVAIQGIGGLGHLGVQVADALGTEVIAISRGEDARDAALDLGADRYIDADAVDVAETLREGGGVDAALSTVPSGEAMSALVGGLAENGMLAVVGTPSDPIELSAQFLLDGDRAVVGASSGTRADRERHLAFCARHDVSPWTEEFPLGDVEAALEAVEEGTARFRAVLAP